MDVIQTVPKYTDACASKMFSHNNVQSVLMHHNETRGSSVGILDGNNSATWLIVRHADDYCPSFAARRLFRISLCQLLRNLQLKINGRDRTWASRLYIDARRKVLHDELVTNLIGL